MSDPLQVGQFAIVEHEPMEMGPNAGVFWGRGPSGDRPELYVVAEGTTPASEAHAGHMVSRLGHVWQSLDLSLTGSLQRIFTQACSDLRDWNRKSIAEHRVRIGMTAVGRRGHQVVVAQAGPASAFHLHDGELRVLRPQAESVLPMGAPKDVIPTLVRIDMAPGDRLLLLSTSAAAQLDDDVAQGVLSLADEQVLANLYRLVDHVRNMSAVLLARPEVQVKPQLRAAREMPLLEEPESEEEKALAPIGPNGELLFQPSLFIETGEIEIPEHIRPLTRVAPRQSISPDVPEVPIDIPAPLRRASGDGFAGGAVQEALARTKAAFPLASASVTLAQPLRTPVPPASTPVESARFGEPARVGRRGSFSRGLQAPDVPLPPSRQDEQAPFVEELAAAQRQHHVTGTFDTSITGEAGEATLSAEPLVKIRSQMSGRWRGGSFSGSGGKDVLHHVPRPWWTIGGGVALLFLLVGYLVLPNLFGTSADERFDTLIRGAEQQLSIARVQTDPAQERTALTTAQAMLLEAREIEPADESMARLLEGVDRSLAGLDNVVEPAAVAVVASLEQFGERPVTPARLVAGGSEVYILDNASGQVVAVSLVDGRFRAVFSENAELQHGKPVAMAYVEGSELGEPSLIIADANRGLWAYSPATGLRVLLFSAPQGLDVRDIAFFESNLFVLDSTAGVIYQFPVVDAGFNVEPSKYLENAELRNAARITADGEVLASDADGVLHRYSGQASLVLSQAGIDKKLVSAQTPQVLGEAGELALADPANDRIVVFRRDGTFDRQYRHTDFAGLTAMAARGEEVFVFSGGQLRRVQLTAEE